MPPRSGLLRTSIATGLVLAVCAAAAAAGGAGAAPAPERPSADQRATCVPVPVGGSGVRCLPPRPGLRCIATANRIYQRFGVRCVRGRLVAARTGPRRSLVDGRGQLSLRTALAIFDATIADLPGVARLPGGGGKAVDPSSALTVIEANLAKLTAAQRAVVLRMTTPGPGALLIPADGSAPSVIQGAARTTASSRGAGPPIAREGVRSADQLPSDFLNCSQTLAEGQTAAAYIQAARRSLESHGFLPARPVALCFLGVQTPPPAVAYTTNADLPPGASTTCNVFVTKAGQSSVEAFKQQFLAHEYAHCTQHRYATSQSDFRAWPRWVYDGTADWLAGMVVQESGAPVVGMIWRPWLREPGTDLFTRTYDAAGFFSMVHQATGQGWDEVRDLFGFASQGSAAAYQRALAGLPEDFDRRWGPGLLRRKTLGPEWDYTGPGIPESVAPEIRIRGDGQPHVIEADAHASGAGKLLISADVVTVRMQRGARGLIKTSAGATARLKTGAFCSRPGGCVCRTRTKLALPTLDRVGTAVGFNAQQRAASVTLTGLSLREYCRNPRPGPAERGTADDGGPVACVAPSATTALAAMAARRPALMQAGACPTSEGIGVLHDNPPNPDVLFREASCTVGGGSFVAILTEGGYRLEIGIRSFTGFGGQYFFPVAAQDPSWVLDGPGDVELAGNRFTSSFGQGVGFDPGDRLTQATFLGRGRQIRFGGTAVGPQGVNGGLYVIGGTATCRYPSDP